MFYQQEHSASKEYFSISKNTNEKFVFPSHLHGNCEFIYVEEGLLRVTINGHDFDVKGGEGAFVLPNQSHAFFTPAFSKSWLVIFSVDHVPELKNIIASKIAFSPVIRPQIPHLRAFFMHAEGNAFRMRSALYELAALYTDGEPMEQLVTEDGALVCRIVSYIDAHYTEALTLEQMARDMGYNYRYMSGIVNRFFKLNFPQTVNHYRVNHACILLEDTSEGIAQIALACGFGSIRNFNRNFKSVMGVSPQEYRMKKNG